MILRFKLYAAAGATAFISSPGGGDAFAVPSASSSSSSSSPSLSRTRRPASAASLIAASLNPDWDNDDFLSSLGGGRDAMDAANEKYLKQAERRAAMDEWRARSAPRDVGGEEGPQQEGGQSPEFFRKMGLSGDGPPPSTGQPQMQPPPQMGQPMPQFGQQPAQQMQPPQPQPSMQQAPPQTGGVPPQHQQQFFDASGNPVSMPMVYDANGNLIPFGAPPPQQPAQMQQQQQGGYVGPAFEPPLPPKTKGTDSPRPVGYNPDAYTMSNTADVYFAQLKQDSKVRKIARMSGDTDRANQVFADDSVQKIRDSWVDNPYTKEKNLAEARAEIEGAVRLQVAGDDNGPSASTGISYKEKLEQIKARRAGGGGAQAAAPPIATSVQPIPEQPKKAAAPKLGEPIDQQKIIFSEPPQASKLDHTKVIPPKAMELPETEQATNPMPSPLTASPPPIIATTSAEPMITDEGDVRGKVRTLQGLLLKHRGGPGFGAGRLKAPEAQRLECTLDEVKGILRSEVGAGGASHPAPVAPLAEMKAPAARQQQSVATAPPPPVMPATPAVPTPAQAATMVSAVASQPPPDPLAGSVACVEAALKMYKESSLAERDALVMPLREALMAAASASNKYIAESEAERHRAAMEAGPVAAVEAMASAPMLQPMMGFPTTYAVTKVDEEDTLSSSHSAQTAASSGIDRAENDKKLEDVYNALVNARGDGGNLGLKNISGEEASALAEKLRTMRGVLLDELNSS